MPKKDEIRIELGPEELSILKDIVENEVIGLSIFYNKKNAKKDEQIRKHFEKLKSLNLKLESQLKYVGSM